MVQIVLYILLGLAAGVLSGLVGIGGGIIVVPALVFIAGMSQQMAQGTTLGMLLPPIGILAVMTYYKQGYVDLKVVALLCVGFVLGGWFGAKIAVGLSKIALQRIFGGVLLVVAIKMIWGK